MRYADAIMDSRGDRIICIREDHREANAEAINTIVAIDAAAGGIGEVLVSGNDFYAAPRLSPDGSHLAWLTWNHPDMPWDAAELWMAPVAEDGSLGPAEHVAGGAGESIFQPEWSPEGVLYFVSDRSNWWNLYRFCDGRIEPVAPMDAEFGMPQWVFRMSTYAFSDAHTIVCTYCKGGAWSLAKIDCRSGKLDPIATPFNSIAYVCAENGQAAFIAASATEAAAVVVLNLESGKWHAVRRSSTITIDPAFISKPQTIEFPSEDGRTAYGIFYAPKNPDYSAPADAKPPLVVMSHGGPTSATVAALSLKTQYYTSRGIGVLDVNYGGSTGYGRRYRECLYGEWGVVDVDDCVNGARTLAERGLVDGQRLAITGGSAGGYTTLSCLAFRDIFAAGASHYGVSDCEALARETHKFESRYLDKLIGPYPERRDLYLERSPVHHVNALSCPVIFFQGLEDKIVPPNQAETMVAALREKGIPVAYVAFAEEQHGFRQAANICRAIEGELYFFSQVFGFEPADPIARVNIANL